MFVTRTHTHTHTLTHAHTHTHTLSLSLSHLCASLPTYQPFSKYPPCNKDISFWIDSDFSDNSFADVVRSVAGDLAEEVKLVGH